MVRSLLHIFLPNVITSFNSQVKEQYLHLLSKAAHIGFCRTLRQQDIYNTRWQGISLMFSIPSSVISGCFMYIGPDPKFIEGFEFTWAWFVADCTSISNLPNAAVSMQGCSSTAEDCPRDSPSTERRRDSSWEKQQGPCILAATEEPSLVSSCCKCVGKAQFPSENSLCSLYCEGKQIILLRNFLNCLKSANLWFKRLTCGLHNA